MMDANDSASDEHTGQTGVEVRELRKEFGDLVAVKDIDLSVRDGEVMVLLGPSGCGKSTTLRMIAGLEMPTDGTVEINGDDVTQLHPRKRDLSLVFQNYALYPHKTVYENLEFPLNKMDLESTEKEEKITEAARLLEIEGILDKKPSQLSGGQRQRVAVGRTIVREPGVFLMDEPLSNLDAKLRVKARSEIRQLQQHLGTTMVYVTHDQEEAMSIADRIAIMNNGEIVQVGTPEEVYTNPTNEFVAEFIGEPAMNFFTTVSAGERESADQLDPRDLGIDTPREVSRLGIRPEDIYLYEEATIPAEFLTDPIECTVSVREPLGHAYELSLAHDDTSLTAWLRDCPADIVEGSTATFAFDRRKVYLFDEEGNHLSEKALSPR